MDEDRAAASSDARAGVMIDLDDQIVECVRAHKPVAGLSRIETDWLVVAAMRWILAPSIVRSDAFHRKPRRRPPPPIVAPPHTGRVKTARGSRTIPFPLVSLDAGTTERHRDAPQASREPALAAVSGACPDIDSGERHVVHQLLIGRLSRPRYGGVKLALFQSIALLAGREAGPHRGS